MKVAVTYDNGQVFQHFGHTKQFKMYDTEDGKIVGSQIVDTMGSGHGALAGFLQTYGINVLICGGIGAGAKDALERAGIELYGGVAGSADDAVNALLNNSLMFNPSVQCSHHGEHGHHEHSCHSHDCGHGSCGGRE